MKEAEVEKSSKNSRDGAKNPHSIPYTSIDHDRSVPVSSLSGETERIPSSKPYKESDDRSPQRNTDTELHEPVVAPIKRLKGESPHTIPYRRSYSNNLISNNSNNYDEDNDRNPRIHPYNSCRTSSSGGSGNVEAPRSYSYYSSQSVSPPAQYIYPPPPHTLVCPGGTFDGPTYL